MAYLAYALSKTIDADKIAVYRSEFKRQGVREDDFEHIFYGALDAEYRYFPSVWELLTHRPKRVAKPYPALSPREQAEAYAARKEFMHELARLCGKTSMS